MKSLSNKVTREAFVYLEPKAGDSADSFAQCESCRMFTPDVPKFGDRCVAHGSFFPVDEDDTCGVYIDWPTPDGEPNQHVVRDHRRELAKGVPGSVTPDESGFLSNKVQCRRCAFFYAEKPKCSLYYMLNKALPNVFSLDDNVKPNACCNAWTG